VKCPHSWRRILLPAIGGRVLFEGCSGAGDEGAGSDFACHGEDDYVGLGAGASGSATGRFAAGTSDARTPLRLLDGSTAGDAQGHANALQATPGPWKLMLHIDGRKHQSFQDERWHALIGRDQPNLRRATGR
jgi:hypothetical protein